MRSFLLIFALAFFTSSIFAQDVPEQLFSSLPDDVTPALSERGKYAVGVKTIAIINDKHVNALKPAENTRPLTVEVWYPSNTTSSETTQYDNQTRSGVKFSIEANAIRDAALLNNSGTKFPVVVLSHGYTGYRTIMFHIGEHLASHGYIAIGIDHTDSTNTDIDFANDAGAGFLSTLMNRAKDQQFVLDWVTSESEFAVALDPDNAGLVGYSMGGYGAVNTIGGCYAFTSQHVNAISGSNDAISNDAIAGALNNCAAGRKEGEDPRWKAAVVMAPWGGQLKIFSSQSLAKIKVPTLYMSGDFDDIVGYEGVRWLFNEHKPSRALLLTYHHARHNIGPHPAPKAAYKNELDIGHYREPSWDSETLAIINQHFTLAMMDCNVKNISTACEYLAVRGSSNQIPVDGIRPEPWKGFDDRYSTGMTMEANTP